MRRILIASIAAAQCADKEMQLHRASRESPREPVLPTARTHTPAPDKGKVAHGKKTHRPGRRIQLHDETN